MKEIKLAFDGGTNIQYVLDRYFDILDQHGFLTVFELFESGFPYEYMSMIDYGWTNLDGLRISRQTGFYIFTFPEPVEQETPLFGVE